jgi:hypothetical protein
MAALRCCALGKLYGLLTKAIGNSRGQCLTGVCRVGRHNRRASQAESANHSKYNVSADHEYPFRFNRATG